MLYGTDLQPEFRHFLRTVFSLQKKPCFTPDPAYDFLGFFVTKNDAHLLRFSRLCVIIYPNRITEFYVDMGRL